MHSHDKALMRSVGISIRDVEPIVYRDTWVERIGGNPYPNVIGLTVSNQTWPERMVPTSTGLSQRGTAQRSVFLVQWFNRVTGASIAMTWEWTEGLRMHPCRLLPDAQASTRALGVMAADVLRSADVPLDPAWK